MCVDKLEKTGLVERKPHNTDRGSYFVVLTRKGEKMFEERHRFHEDFTREVSTGLTNFEDETLTIFLGKVLEKM